MSDIKKLQIILKKNHELLGFLPSKKDKIKVIEGLDELISFLNEVKEILQRMPSLEEAEKAKKALEGLENILQRNPIIKQIIVGKHVKTKCSSTLKQPKVNFTIDEKLIEKELNKLQKLSESKIRTLLANDKKYTKKLLLAICQKLGRSVSSRSTRKELVEIIVTTIVNKRTYEGLMNPGD